MKIFCLKCKAQTDTKDTKKVKSGARMMVKGTCAKCGTKKNKFISKTQKGGCGDDKNCGCEQKGNGLISDIKDISKVAFKKASNIYRASNCDGKSRPLELGEIHVPCHNFTGPGTKMNIPKVYNFPAYNEIDQCSKIHDQEYNKIFKMPLGPAREKAIRVSDEKVLKCYDKYPNVQGYTLAKAGIKGKMAAENYLPEEIVKSIAGGYYGAGKGKTKKRKTKKL